MGGVIGLLAAGFVLLVGGVGSAFTMKDAGLLVNLGWAALALSVVGIVGGAVAPPKPRTGGCLMLVAGGGGLVAVWAAYCVAGPLLVIGGLLALLSPNATTRRRETEPAQVLSPMGGGGRGYGGDVLVMDGTVLTQAC